jgi:hypothetical protein
MSDLSGRNEGGTQMSQKRYGTSVQAVLSLAAAFFGLTTTVGYSEQKPVSGHSGALKHHAWALSYMRAPAWSTHQTRDGSDRLLMSTAQQIHVTVLAHEFDRGLRPRHSKG